MKIIIPAVAKAHNFMEVRVYFSKALFPTESKLQAHLKKMARKAKQVVVHSLGSDGPPQWDVELLFEHNSEAEAFLREYDSEIPKSEYDDYIHHALMAKWDYKP